MRSICALATSEQGGWFAVQSLSRLAGIGSPPEVSVLHLAKAVRDIVGSRSPIVFAPRPVDDPSVRQPDITLARHELGWEPAVGYEEGLRRTVAWFADTLLAEQRREWLRSS